VPGAQKGIHSVIEREEKKKIFEGSRCGNGPRVPRSRVEREGTIARQCHHCPRGGKNNEKEVVAGGICQGLAGGSLRIKGDKRAKGRKIKGHDLHRFVQFLQNQKTSAHQRRKELHNAKSSMRYIGNFQEKSKDTGPTREAKIILVSKGIQRHVVCTKSGSNLREKITFFEGPSPYGTI